MDWNVVVTVKGEYADTLRHLRRFGEIHRTSFFNVLLLDVPDVEGFLHQFEEAAREAPEAFESVSHLMPVKARFRFHGPEELESKARKIALGWLEELAGRSFHIRMHRRGLKGRLHTMHEEQLLGRMLLEHLTERGTPAHLDFEDPDAILSIETVGDEAGLAVWQRGDLERHPILRRSLELPERTDSKEREAGQEP